LEANKVNQKLIHRYFMIVKIIIDWIILTL